MLLPLPEVEERTVTRRKLVIPLATAVALSMGATIAVCKGSAGVMLGAHVGRQYDPTWQADFEALERAIGRKLAIDNDQEDWAVMPNTSRINWDIRNRRMPMISWTVSNHKSDPAAGCATADAILTGSYDRQFEKQAAAVKAFGAPILVRFNYEMTGNEAAGCFTGFEVRENPSLAGSKYVSVWKHVVDKFRAAGASNAKWVWAPGHKAYETGEWRLFYPGNAYVDWVAVDDYNKSDTARSFAADPGINAFYRTASGMGKPLMIAETGAVSDPTQNPDPQTLWLTTARIYLKTHPAIKAFVWWNNPGKLSREDPEYGGSGYVLQGPGLAAFRAMANDPYFQQ